MKPLKDRLIEGENEEQSFFENTENSLEIAKTLVAFANCDGGTLLIGLKKNGKIIGVNPEVELKIVSMIAEENCEPNINFSSRIIQEGFRILLEIFVLSADVKPCKVISDSKKEIFIRKDNVNIIANKIIESVWKYKVKNSIKPVCLSTHEIEVRDFIKRSSKASLTKIYKNFDLPMDTIDYILVRLITWKIIFMDLSEKGSEFTSIN